jgi:hypothetical protein
MTTVNNIRAKWSMANRNGSELPYFNDNSICEVIAKSIECQNVLLSNGYNPIFRKTEHPNGIVTKYIYFEMPWREAKQLPSKLESVNLTYKGRDIHVKRETMYVVTFNNVVLNH